MEAIREAIGRLIKDEGIDGELSGFVAGEILAGEATEAQIGAFLTALNIRGEKPEHLIAFARSMREHAQTLDADDRDGLVDTCGTGGDRSGTFNISTAAAIIAAGAGARVAKHGNRAASSRCGSADVLEALGVNIEMTPATAARCLKKAGITFLFARTFHGAMRHVAAPRAQLGAPTIFNKLGPLANPARARRQLVGVSDPALAPIYARVFADLGATHVMVVHGLDGLDEITLTGPTEITEYFEESQRAYTFSPEEVGLELAQAEDLGGGDAQTNASILRSILAGDPGPPRAIAELNAAAALVVSGKAANMQAGFQMAKEAIDSGAAGRALDRLAEISNKDDAE